MTEEKLRTRLKEIEDALNKTANEIKKLEVNRVLLSGGKQEILYWLEERKPAD